MNDFQVLEDGSTVTRIEVPSGKMVVTDDLRKGFEKGVENVLDTVLDWRVKESFDSLDRFRELARKYQSRGMFYGVYTNGSVNVYRTDDQVFLATDWDRGWDPQLMVADREASVFQDLWVEEGGPLYVDSRYSSLVEGVQVAHVSCDLWAWNATDLDCYLALGGDIDDESFDVIDVEPGVYEFVHHGFADDFDVHGDRWTPFVKVLTTVRKV